MILDNDKERKYHCATCDATETITKSEKAGWWYHGWKASDGRRLRVPTVQEMDRGIYGWQPE
jgi:hypothetical protein